MVIMVWFAVQYIIGLSQILLHTRLEKLPKLLMKYLVVYILNVSLKLKNNYLPSLVLQL